MTPLQRRAFLQRAALVAAAGTLPRWAWSNHPLQHDPFALGVASGDPTPDGVVLWTRLLPTQHGDLSDPFTVRWELADDPAFRRIVQRGQATALPALGHSVHVELTGLAPARWYHYRFMLGDAISATGRTRTAPAADAMDAHLRIAFASCQRWEHGHYAAWRHLCADQPDLVLFLGDYIYEYASPPATTGLARVHALRHASTLADFRDRYALHKSDPALQAAHAACPWAVTWDDHEVQNDYAGAQGKGSQGDPVAFLALRSAAWQAFYENMPLRAASLLAPDFGALQVYRRLRWGRLAQVHLLDTRQHRQWQQGPQHQIQTCLGGVDLPGTQGIDAQRPAHAQKPQLSLVQVKAQQVECGGQQEQHKKPHLRATTQALNGRHGQRRQQSHGHAPDGFSSV